MPAEILLESDSAPAQAQMMKSEQAANLQPIDRPFRFTWDFCVVWIFLAVVMYFITRRTEQAEIPVSYIAELILVPLFATFVLYGPVLLARQIVQSGSRGWFVARVFVSILLAAAIFAAVLYLTGHVDVNYSAAVMMSFFATIYLNWRLREKPDNPHAKSPTSDGVEPKF